MSRGLPATVRGDRMRRGRKAGVRRRAARTPPAAGRDLYGGVDCVGGAFGRWYAVGYRADGAACVLASCATRGAALALAALFRARLPQYARVAAERAGGGGAPAR